MDKSIHIISLSEKPELASDAIEYANQNWPYVSKYFVDAVSHTITGNKQLPLTFLLVKNEKIIGFYTLQEHDVIERKDLTPWITLIFVDEQERGQGLVKDILLHGRKMAGDLGFNKVYLSSNHIQLYEKYGFKEIGLDMFVWGKPTKLYENATIREKKGKIVFLNGVSSSGKTTLALALQEKSENTFFIIAQDIFRQMWGRKYNEDSPNNIYNTTMSLMYKTIKLFADEGKNVIVDHLIFTDDFLDSYNGEGTLKDAVNVLSNYPVLFVHVTCNVEELRIREKARGDREIGHAESQLEYLSPKDNYDLTIDTQATTTDEAIEMIIKSLDNIYKVSAFSQLSKKV